MSIEEATRTITAPGQMFEMEEVEIRGVPTRVWKNCPANLPGGPGAVAGPRRHATTSSTRTNAPPTRSTSASPPPSPRACATGFGVELGDRVAIAMRNLPEWAMAFWGAAAAGRRGGAAQRLVDEPRAALRPGRLGDQGGLRRRGPPRPPDAAPGRAPRSSGRGGHPRGPHRGVRAPPRARAGRLLRGAGGHADADVTLPEVTIDPEDDATIFYTSGTTGKPKGAVGTHRNMGTNLMSLFFLNTRAGLRSPSQARPRDDRPRRTGRLPAVGAAVPRHGMSLDPGGEHRGGEQARHDAPLGSRAGPRAHRARADRDLRGRPRHGDAGDRRTELRHARHLVDPLRRLRRGARPTRPRASDQGALPRERALQRLRADRDVLGDHHEQRRRLRPPARQRRPTGPGVRRRGSCPTASTATSPPTTSPAAPT